MPRKARVARRVGGVAIAPVSPRTRARPRHDAKCATARAMRGIRFIETLAGSRVPRELGPHRSKLCSSVRSKTPAELWPPAAAANKSQFLDSRRPIG
jgi:hypothetical protein